MPHISTFIFGGSYNGYLLRCNLIKRTFEGVYFEPQDEGGLLNTYTLKNVCYNANTQALNNRHTSDETY